MIPLTLLRLSFAAISATFQFLSVFCNTLHLLRVPEDYASAVVGKGRAGMSEARCGCAVFPFRAESSTNHSFIIRESPGGAE